MVGERVRVIASAVHGHCQRKQREDAKKKSREGKRRATTLVRVVVEERKGDGA
jgi:hypothetical protein